MRRVPHSFACVANEWVLRAAAVGERFHQTRHDLRRPLLKVEERPFRAALASKSSRASAPEQRSHRKWREAVCDLRSIAMATQPHRTVRGLALRSMGSLPFAPIPDD